jgi:hypothetical protein
MQLGKNQTPAAEERRAVLARLSATVDAEVLATARAFANATGFRHSFSAYLTAVLQRDNRERANLLSESRSRSPMTS